jgi:hypothetical protein
MAIKNSKSRLSKTLGLSPRQQKSSTPSPPSALSRAPELPVSGLKEDRSRIRITREGNDLRTFTPARDAARRAEVQRQAAELASSDSES